MYSDRAGWQTDRHPLTREFPVGWIAKGSYVMKQGIQPIRHLHYLSYIFLSPNHETHNLYHRFG